MDIKKKTDFNERVCFNAIMWDPSSQVEVVIMDALLDNRHNDLEIFFAISHRNSQAQPTGRVVVQLSVAVGNVLRRS